MQSLREQFDSLMAALPAWAASIAAPDAVIVLAYFSIAGLILRQSRTLPPSLLPVFAILGVFAISCAVTHLLWSLAANSSAASDWQTIKYTAAAMSFGIMLLLFWVLPRAASTAQDERKEDLARLRLLAAAVNASGDGMMIAEVNKENDALLSIVYANPAFERLTGYASEEALGCSPSILPDDQDDPEALDAVRKAMRGRSPVRLEVPSRRKDGGRIWTEWQIVPVADDAGQHSHSVAVLRDTTERRSSEQAMRESEERFRGLFEHAADAIFVIDGHGRIADVNRRACLMLGYARHELLEMKISELEASAKFDDVSPAETMTSAHCYRRKDGSTFPVEVRFAQLESGGKRLKLGLVRDVTRRRRAEQTLREREELLRNVITHIPCGVFWKDCNSVYLGCNQQIARDLGYSGPEQLVGKTDFDLGVTHEEATLYRKYDQLVIGSGEPVLNIEETQTNRDRSRMTLLTSKVPLRDSNGSVVGVLGVYQDITDRKRLEEQLRQAQKMDAVGRLAGGIAHDFNNLLTVIRGNSELLRDSFEDSSQVNLIEEVCLAADRAAGLVRQLLTFSRRQSLRLEVIDLNAVVSGLAGMLRRLLGERIAIETRLSSSPVTTRADYRHLEQVVMNLAVNARDAMPNGGTLTIGTQVLSGPGNPATARLWVADTGSGMTDEVKGRIFEPFFTTKGPDKGTGLGLATVFGIVEQATGKISVDSTPGIGTMFRVDLPWFDGLPTSSITPLPMLKSLPPPRSGATVLLVEDEESVRKFARITLESNGYSVMDAPDGDAALRMLESIPQIDLLVTDLTMPGIDGRELACQVRNLQPDVAIVVMSGYVSDLGWLDGLKGTIFLPKPFTPLELLRATNKVFLQLESSETPANRALEVLSQV